MTGGGILNTNLSGVDSVLVYNSDTGASLRDKITGWADLINADSQLKFSAVADTDNTTISIIFDDKGAATNVSASSSNNTFNVLPSNSDSTEIFLDIEAYLYNGDSLNTVGDTPFPSANEADWLLLSGETDVVTVADVKSGNIPTGSGSDSSGSSYLIYTYRSRTHYVTINSTTGQQSVSTSEPT